jgi:hypothetical protein
MSNVVGEILRVVAGLLAAGVLAPFVFALPDRAQSPWLVLVLAVVCVMTALLVRRRRQPEP